MLKQPSPEYRGFRAGGIRLREEMLPQLGKLAAGRSRLMFHALHAFDKAQAVMLVEEELLSREHGKAILEALRRMEKDGVEETRTKSGGGLHSGEQYLIRALGEEIGGRLHLGRSSGDLSSVGINTLQREKVLRILEGVNKLRRVLIGLARRHMGTILPGYSFGQHAQPMTLAHLLLSWAANLARDFERLHGVYGRVNTSPAGAAIMVGSDFPLNRERTAELLGFDSIHENMADAILELNADDSLDVPMAVALLYHTLAKWADDLILWSTSEFGFVDIPDRFCNTSSIMMQKKNVIGPAEVKGASAEAIGCVVTAYHALKGPTGLPITEALARRRQLREGPRLVLRAPAGAGDPHRAHARAGVAPLGDGDRSRGRARPRAEPAVAHRAPNRRHPRPRLRGQEGRTRRRDAGAPRRRGCRLPRQAGRSRRRADQDGPRPGSLRRSPHDARRPCAGRVGAPGGLLRGRSQGGRGYGDCYQCAAGRGRAHARGRH